MPSEIDVCNDALAMLGEPEIIAYTDGILGSRCQRLYPRARDFVLRAHPWSRARKQASLTQADYDGTGWDHEYILPADHIRMLKVVTNSGATVDWEMREGRMVSDADSVEILYIYRVTDLTVMDASFWLAVAAYLAYLLAATVTKDRRIVQEMYQMYKMQLLEAKFVDATESEQPKDEEVDWAEVGREDPADEEWRRWAH